MKEHPLNYLLGFVKYATDKCIENNVRKINIHELFDIIKSESGAFIDWNSCWSKYILALRELGHTFNTDDFKKDINVILNHKKRFTFMTSFEVIDEEYTYTDYVAAIDVAMRTYHNNEYSDPVIRRLIGKLLNDRLR